LTATFFLKDLLSSINRAVTIKISNQTKLKHYGNAMLVQRQSIKKKKYSKDIPKTWTPSEKLLSKSVLSRNTKLTDFATKINYV
jgi:hypothetical protein